MTPGSIFVLESGGLDALVALVPLLRAMNRAWPRTRITVGCREELTGIEHLWPVQAATVSIGATPFTGTEFTSELTGAVSLALSGLRGVEADWFLCAERTPGWFARVAGTWFGARRTLYLGSEPPLAGLGGVLTRELTLDPVRFEWESTEGLKLTVEPESAPWILPAKLREKTLELLEQLGLRQRHYLACVPEPRWGAARYGEAIEELRLESDIPVLILGTGDSPAGGTVRCHAPESLESAAALLALSRAYLTGDQGRAALAHSYGIKGAALAGGGDAPPAAPSISHPLPCFGCQWDCLFATPVCMDLIPVMAVVRQARAALAGESIENTHLDALTGMEMALIARADSRYRAVAAESRIRQQQLVELRYGAENARPRRR